MKNVFAPGNRQLTFILITMFLNALGFSIIIPILPFLVETYVKSTGGIAFSVGLLVSIYALCQFVAAPGLGALSDRFGRRPILLVSLLGSAIGYLFLGFGGALWVLFLGRVIDGLTGGNISTIYAYMADITQPQERGKMFGTLGAAWGFGFMIGPAIGGFLSPIHITTPLFVAAGITFLNLLWGYFVLPESLPHEHKISSVTLSHLSPFSQFKQVFSLPMLRRIFLFGFLFFIAFNASYGINSVFWKDVFSWSPIQIGVLLFFVGILDIFSQGYLVRKLLPFFHEANLSLFGTLLAAVGFGIVALTTFIASPLLLLLGVFLLNIGDGLFEPTMGGLISNSVAHNMQGRVQGANQSMQSVARVIGPLLAAWLYQDWKGLPYAFNTLLCVGAFAILFLSLSLLKQKAPQAV